MPGDRRKANSVYNPSVSSSLNSGIDPTASIPLKFHPELPDTECKFGVDLQRHHSSQAGAGTLRGADSVPPSQPSACGCNARTAASAGTPSPPTSTTAITARRTTASPALSSFPDQFYDYHWPIVLAGLTTDQHRRHRSPRRQPRRQWRHQQGARRLARDHEHPLVPRSHVQLHLAERVQGQRRHVQHLQRADRGNEVDQRRREPAPAQRHGQVTGATWTTTST